MENDRVSSGPGGGGGGGGRGGKEWVSWLPVWISTAWDNNDNGKFGLGAWNVLGPAAAVTSRQLSGCRVEDPASLFASWDTFQGALFSRLDGRILQKRLRSVQHRHTASHNLPTSCGRAGLDAFGTRLGRFLLDVALDLSAVPNDQQRLHCRTWEHRPSSGDKASKPAGSVCGSSARLRRARSCPDYRQEPIA